jgi:GNAT superfamily N-acetyltransferase
MLHIRMFHPHEWPLYRDLRLAALRDAPGAFGSTLSREEPLADDEWRRRLTHGVSSALELPLVAEHDGRAAGLCWARIDPDDATVASLYSVWVHPDARGHGVARGLLDAAMRWAREAGAQRMALTVSLGGAAVPLYRHAGFFDVGAPHPLREGSALLQQAMHCDLTVW